MERSYPSDLAVLVIDDSVHLRALITAYLRKLGFSRILQADNGLAGVEQYKKSRPDLVLLDYVMPEMNGITTLREIRKFDESAVVLMITSISTKEKVVELKDAGAFSYLLKPFEEAKFGETIRKAVDHIKNISQES